MKLLNELIERHLTANNLSAAVFEGASEQEVRDLEQRMDHVLPEIFRQYLRVMGHETGHLLEGSDILFGCLHLLTSEGRQAMTPESMPLPDDAFVFFAHQGYGYMWFRTSEGDDPPVYRWLQGRQVEQRFERFSEYLRWMFNQG